MNAFSKDLDIVDTLLPFYLFEFLSEGVFMFTSMLAVIACAPLVLGVAIPSTYLFWQIRKVYMGASREIKRMEASSRSPVLSLLVEAVTGSALISAHRLRKHFVAAYYDAASTNTTLALHLYLLLPWLTFMLDLLGTLVLIACVLSTLVGIGSPMMTGAIRCQLHSPR